MQNIAPPPYRQWLKAIASPAVLFYALPWLMLILIAGTYAQKDLGIFEAQKMYFSSWFIWFGFVPMPGAYITLGTISVCLLAKFLLYSPWRKHQAGIILAHLGVLILMIGGLLTALTQREGFMSIGEGQNANAISSYHDRVLSIEKDGDPYAQIPFESLVLGQDLTGVSLPFNVTVQDVCKNCKPSMVKNAQGRHGLAEKVSLTEAPPEREDETDLAGVTLKLSGLKGNQNGVYVTMEEIPHKPAVDAGKATYAFHMNRAQKILPFSIELKDFKRDVHPGTDMARGFSSEILVHDGKVSWPYTIRMNEPLRYKGYTFYQASFTMRPDGEYSVFSVVKNKGRVFPYLASIIIFCGLLLHVVIRLSNRKDRT